MASYADLPLAKAKENFEKDSPGSTSECSTPETGQTPEMPPSFFYSGRVSPRREAQDLAVRVPADLKGLYAPLPIPLLPSPLHPCHNIGLILSMERGPTLHLERLRRVELVLHEDGRGDVGEAKAISSGLVADVAG
jgi:hypothetical protein